MKNQYLTKVQREQFTLSEILKEILEGLYLGDLCGQRQKASKKARLMFRQGLIYKDYLLHLYEKFSNYCPIVPKYQNTKIPKKKNIIELIHYSTGFISRDLRQIYFIKYDKIL